MFPFTIALDQVVVRIVQGRLDAVNEGAGNAKERPSVSTVSLPRVARAR
jgi:hypothetical protein